MTRVLVCGGRYYSDAARVEDILNEAHAKNPISVLIHGAATGADSLAAEWANLRGVEVISCPAQWILYDKAAGPIRNAYMLATHRPDLLIAFPGNRGTRDMVLRAKRAGVFVFAVQP